MTENYFNNVFGDVHGGGGEGVLAEGGRMLYYKST